MRRYLTNQPTNQPTSQPNIGCINPGVEVSTRILKRNHCFFEASIRLLHVALIISLLLSLLGLPYAVSASETDSGLPDGAETKLQRNQPNSDRELPVLPHAFPKELEASFPGDILANLNSPLQAPEGRQLSCTYLGGGADYPNQCSPTPSTVIHHDFEIQGSGFNGYHPQEQVKIVCTGQGCTQVPVYFSLFCSVNWTDPFGKTLTNYVEVDKDTQSGTPPIESDEVPCGSGYAGGCSLSLAGRFPPEEISPDPSKDWHLYSKMGLKGGISAYTEWTYDCSWTWSLDPILQDMSALSSNQTKDGLGDPRECEISSCDDAQAVAGDPINTRTGNFDYSRTDLLLPTLAGPLTFQRSYASQGTGLYTGGNGLGKGWAHNQNVKLIFKEGFVWFKGHTANLYKFHQNGDGSYTPYPGVLASLIKNPDNTYTLKTASQSIYTFDSGGKLTSWRNELGFGFDYTYTGDKVSWVTEPISGRYLQFTYTGDRLTSVADQTGRSIALGYDGNLDLTSFTDVRGKTWTYVYSNNRMIEVKAPGSPPETVLVVAYDGQGRAEEQWNGMNQRLVKIQYNSDGTSAIKDALDRSQTHGYDIHNTNTSRVDTTGYSTTKSFDDNLRPELIRDADNRETTLQWSANGANLLYVRDAIGYETSLEYDLQNHLTRVLAPHDREITFTYDGARLTSSTMHLSVGDATTVYSYTTTADAPQPVGLLKTVTDPLNRQTHFEYDSAGQLVVIRDALGHETRLEYDSIGRIIEVTRMVDPITGRKTRIDYDLAGNVVKITRNYDPARPQNDENQYNLVAEYVYDDQGRLTRTTDTLGYTTDYVYDDAGRLEQAIDAYDHSTSYAYNQAGQLISVTDPLTHTTSLEYDSYGRLYRLIDPRNNATTLVYNTDSTIHSVTNPVGYSLTYQYDDLKRLTGISDNMGSAVSNTLDAYGNALTATDALGRVTSYEYDQRGLLVAVVENYLPGQAADHQTNVRTEYEYDLAGNLWKVRDANGHETVYQHDELNRLEKTVDPLLRETDFDYDALGNLASVHYPKGYTTSYAYDLADRLHSVDYPGGAEEDLSLDYDPLGRLTDMYDELGHTQWAWDALGRITSVTDPFDRTVGYGYDAVGNRSSLAYPGGPTLTYQYDEANLLQSVLEGANQLADYQYDEANRLVQAELANGVLSTYEYDLAGRIESLRHTRQGQTLPSFEYAYDATGNRTQVIEVQPTVDLDHLFGDGFESGDLSAWSGYQSDGGDLQVVETSSLVGNHALRATLNDNHELYVVDDTPLDEASYHARFYFDPNAISMADGDAHTIFQALDSSQNPVAGVELGYNHGYYQARAFAVSDSGTPIETPWVVISDEPHGIEISWSAATSPSSQDGSLVYSLDGVEKSSLSGIDNDTRRIQSARMGAVSGIDDGTRGAYHFDAFESCRFSVIGLDPTGPLPQSFVDGFETGNLLAWSSVVGSGTALTITAQAAIAGAKGLEVYDETVPYVEKVYSPTAEYHARFYFDTNSVSWTSGSAVQLFSLLDAESEARVLLKLQMSAGDHQVRAAVYDDQHTAYETPPVLISDGLHALEVEWAAATTPEAQDGSLTFWVDGVQQGSLTNLDLDYRIATARLGLLQAIPGWEAPLYFDCFASNFDHTIGLDPNAPPPTPWPPKPDDIFADSFESGDFSAWSLSLTDGGDLSVSTQAAISGTYGMKAVLDDTNSIYVEDWSPFEETRYRARFYFDLNGIRIFPQNCHSIFQAYDRNNLIVARIELCYIREEVGRGLLYIPPPPPRYIFYYEVRASVVNDGGTWSDILWQITDAPHRLEIDWRAATAPGTNNGGVTLWVDSVQRGTLTNIDNDTRRIDYVRWGAVEGIDNKTQGTCYFDDFVSRRETYIGMRQEYFGWSETPVTTNENNQSRTILVQKVLASPPSIQPTEERYHDLPSSNGPQNQATALEVGRLAAPLSEFITSTVTISYTYDPLNRLTDADYSDGSYFHYAYDAAGNRVSQATPGGTTTYLYDAANQLTSVNSVTYTWDANGNLISDGAYTYAYDYENRLISASGQGSTYGFAYNGLGNRYQQTVNGETTTYALDLASSLPQVLSDGANTYLYGLGRLAQQNASGMGYYLPDALGSLRQLMDGSGQMTLSQSFDPFGNLLSRSGAAFSHYGFAGEWTDATGLQHLRARYYAPLQGRFMSRDPFPGLPGIPATLHPYVYALNNPVLYTDPSGEAVPIILLIAAGGFIAGVTINTVQQYQENGGWCNYDWLEMLEWGVGGAAAASALAILGAASIGLIGMGLQGVAITLAGLGIAAPVISSLWGWGTAITGLGGAATTWLWTGRGLIDKTQTAQRVLLKAAQNSGRKGEELASIIRNTAHIPSLTKTASYRVPDQLNGNLLSEVKNVGYQAFSNQIRDYMLYAQQEGLKFVLIVRQNTELSKPLQAVIDTGMVILQRYLPP